MNKIKRILNLKDDLQRKSVLLLGPRQTGKSTLIKQVCQNALIYDLLEFSTFQELSARPTLIRETLKNNPSKLVVIDEIQKLPLLMDEVHSLIESTGTHFLLTGSSARKLKKTHTSLLGGRARTKFLYPFCAAEVDFSNLEKIFSLGTLPPLHKSNAPQKDLKDYTGIYLKEEIQAEALTRNIQNYSRFLISAAALNGCIINYEKLASHTQLAPSTVRDYYQILKDTLICTEIEPIHQNKKKAVSKSKIYFFDTGVVHSLLKKPETPENTTEFGLFFETTLINEIIRYNSYFEKDWEISFWADFNHGKIDLIINQEIGIEFKSSQLITNRDLKGFEAFSKIAKLKRKIIVSRDRARRTIEGIEVYPYMHFLKNLWSGEF